MAEIVTEGNGWVERTADRAELGVNFAATGRTRADAVAALGAQVSTVQPVLALPGVQVRSRRLWVRTDWRKDRAVGCRAVEEITLRLVDVAILEDVLNGLIGSEPESLSGPSWLLEDQTAATREAQHNAVADARTRAEGYATALGGTLGPLVRLSELTDGGGPPVILRAMASHAEPVVDVQNLELEPELVRVSARCNTTWQLTDPS